jgi:predicted DNA-binding transcriptional regulator AlpA
MHSETEITPAMAAQSAQTPLNPHKRITARTVCDMCGGVSDMTLHRWLKDPDKEFPRPIYIGKRRYWREADVIAWLDAQAVTAA